MNEIEEYIEKYRAYHKTKNSWTGGDVMPGNMRKKNLIRIRHIIEITNSETVLDYGCGKGRQYTEKKVHEQWGVDMPALYDPAVPEFQTIPDGTFDGVICTDVMEHIPDSGLDYILDDVIKRATKFVYFHVSNRLANAKFEDGENIHCIVENHKWWLDRIGAREYAGLRIYVSSEQGYDLLRSN